MYFIWYNELFFAIIADMKVTILGVRGSIPVSGEENSIFGGDTTCVMVETERAVLFLDAGTGIRNAGYDPDKKIAVLISHPHADHLLGLPFFPYLSKKDQKINICSTVKNWLDTFTQVSRLISPPLWPCGILDYPADVSCRDLSFPCTIGDIRVTGLSTDHPGGSTVYRIQGDGGDLVFATDYEHSPSGDEELIHFASGTDLLLYDGQYTPEEFKKKKGYGHSTPEHGVYIGEKCGAGIVRMVHHDPMHDDSMLLKMEDSIKTDTTAFARQGEIIWLQK